MSKETSHEYEWDAVLEVYVCKVCKSTKHRNGDYWWLGHKSKVSPPCTNDAIADFDKLNKWCIENANYEGFLYEE
ncbi:hypothetical protein ID858_07885 [Xenorhabdus sp. DI]|uniref:hypothetical protein n=1 Tax=Xenorhabdus doucetiae TaxID=351671 RepID=UPI0019B16081|nr:MULTISPECIES: hypothetical protein [unclassified Xenorhabdus]MBD2785403.1 hypothetical protein [Xenorhabdus sp. 3]MBD2788427.1 hypothetical protein [Xenorhabdus sp. DI]MBD2798330.1 hypothetical protein [Xenorhabdus sp. 18]